MDADRASEGERFEGTDDRSVAPVDRHADDVAALHRLASLAPGDPDERLRALLAAGCAALDVRWGHILLGTGAGVGSGSGPGTAGGLVVRARSGEGEGVGVGDVVADHRIADVLERQVTVATLGGPGASALDVPLGAGALVACPLWVTGRVAGAIAFTGRSHHDPFTPWQLALVDLVADGVARILEHESDIRALVRLESQAQAVIALLPDPVVRLHRDGQRLDDDSGRPLGPFDPCAGLRGPGVEPDAETLARATEAVATAVGSGRLVTEVFAAGPGPRARRVEARFVPAGGDEALGIVRDVTDRHRAEVALAEQVAFEALVASTSTRLIGCAPALLDEAIEAALAEIASFFRADRAFIDELSPDGSTLRVSHQWSSPRTGRTRRRGDRVDVAGFGWLTARFERDGHVFVRGPDAIPPEAAEQPFPDEEERGLLWVRLGYAGELMGVLGLTWRTHEPPESEEVLGLVRLAADALQGAIGRRSVAQLAHDQADVFELIARGAPLDTALLAARDLLQRHTLGATVVLATVADGGGLRLVVDPADDAAQDGWVRWFAELAADLENPFGQAVITGEPVLVADATGDPRFGRGCLPDAQHRSASIVAVRSPRTGRCLAVLGLLGSEVGAPVARSAVRDSVVALVTVALERSIDERRLAHQATHDPLTGVGNRAALLDRLTLVLARARRTGCQVAVLFCDLDGFKSVNDRFGHDRGDRLLVEVADRIGRAVRPSDTVCRTGGDEFVVVCDDLADPEQAHAIAARVRSAIESSPVDVGEARLPVGVSVGVAIADLPVDDPDRLLRTADLAMYANKQRRSASRREPVIDLTDAGLRAGPGIGPRAGTVGRIGERTEPLRSDLEAALAEDRLELAHQPLVGRDGSLLGVEVLLRWHHHHLGPLGPEQILAATADDVELAARLGRWVRRTGLAQRRRWSTGRRGDEPAPAHVNVDARELAQPGFVEALLVDLAEVGATTEDLVVEVRERDLADRSSHAVVDHLAGEGIAVLVEGVGQGGLSLVELAALPVRGLKVGRSLVARIGGDDPSGLEVVRSLVMLAHGLGWRSLAVGVETDHQRAVLFGFGVDGVQGRAVTMPVSPEALLAWLAARS